MGEGDGTGLSDHKIYYWSSKEINISFENTATIIVREFRLNLL